MISSRQHVLLRGQARVVLVLAGVGLAGAILVLLLFYALCSYEDREVRRQFAVQSHVRAEAICKTMQIEMARLEGLNFFFQSSEEVTRDEFAQFAIQDLRQSQCLQVLVWAPRTKRSDVHALHRRARQDGMESFQLHEFDGEELAKTSAADAFPIYYLVPYLKNDELLGLDLTTVPDLAAAMDRACATGEPELLDGATLKPDGEYTSSFSLVMPVFDRDAVLFTPEDRREGLEGYLIGTYDLAALVEHGLQSVQPGGLHLTVYSQGDDPVVRYVHRARRGSDPEALIAAPLYGQGDQLHATSEINFGDAGWTFVFTAVPGFRVANSLALKWIVLPTGATLLTLLCWLVYTQYSQAQRVRGRVRQRTRELTQLNMDLRVEIEERRRAEATVRAQAAFTQKLIDSIACPMFHTDGQGRYRHCNQAFLEAFGLRKQQVIGKPVSEIKSCDLADISKIDQRLLERGGSHQGEVKVRYADGIMRDLFMTKAVVPGAEGETPGLVGVLFDITHRKQAEMALRMAEQRNRAILDNVQLGIALLDQNLTVVSANSQFRSWFPMFDVGETSICGEQFCSRIVGAGCGSCPTREAFDTGQATNSTLLIQHEGESRNYRIVVSPICSDSGDVISGIVMLEDITEDVRAERERLQIQAAVNSTSDGVLVVDREGCVEYANLAAANLLGMSRDDLWGSDFGRHLVGDDPERLMDHIAQRANWTGEIMLSSDDGRLFPAFVRCSEVTEEAGGFLGSVIIVNDITKQRQREQEMHQATRLMSIGQLAAGIAHEINTPSQYVGDNIRFLQDGFADLLSLLKLNIELCRKQHQGHSPELDELQSECEQVDIDFLLEEVPQAIEQSLEGIGRIASIVQAMKAFSHPGREQEKQAVDINAAIESTVTISRNEWKYHSEMKLSLQPDLPRIQVIADEMNQVFLNLIVNASQAMQKHNSELGREKGEIEIVTALEEEHLVIRVRDNAGGIPKDIRDRIFDPFFTTKQVGEGTGQGLSIVHSIVVKHHGGTIRCESQPGEGTTFIVALPLEPQDEAPMDEQPSGTELQV
jgi:PAS domain S-box-containing protein